MLQIILPFLLTASELFDHCIFTIRIKNSVKGKSTDIRQLIKDWIEVKVELIKNKLIEFYLIS